MGLSAVLDFGKWKSGGAIAAGAQKPRGNLTRRIVSDAGALNEKGAFERHAALITVRHTHVTRRSL
jgi:hypothetical protein